MTCPDCGRPLPSSGVCYNCLKNENDANRFGGGSGIVPAYIKYGPQGNVRRYIDPGPRRKIGKRNKNQDWPTQPVSIRRTTGKAIAKPRRSPSPIRKRSRLLVQLPKGPLRGAALAHQRRGVNKFLYAVYKQPVFISDILKQEGFNDHQVEAVQGKAALYLLQLVKAWCRRWNKDLLSRRIFMVANYYSFGGEVPREPSYFARRFNRPVKSVNHDLKGAISQLRRRDRKKRIEKLITETAWSVLPGYLRRTG